MDFRWLSQAEGAEVPVDQEPEEFICRPCDYEGVGNKPETLGACWDRRRLRGAAGRKTLFGSSDVTLANGCCEYDLLDDRIIFNGGKRKLTADRKLKKQARKPHK